LKFAADWQRWSPSARPAITRIPDTKMRSFISPGEILELRMDFAPPSESNRAIGSTSVRANGKAVASGKLEMTARSST